MIDLNEIFFDKYVLIVGLIVSGKFVLVLEIVV